MERLVYIGDEKEVIEILEKSITNIIIVRSHKDMEGIIKGVVKAKPVRLFLLEE